MTRLEELEYAVKKLAAKAAALPKSDPKRKQYETRLTEYAESIQRLSSGQRERPVGEIGVEITTPGRPN